MAPLDWDRLMKLDVRDLEEDEALTEDLYEILQDYNISGEDDPDRLRHLATITIHIMTIKGATVSVLEDELKETAQFEGKKGVKKDQELETLKDDLEFYKRKCKDLEKFSGTGGDSRETRFLRDEMLDMEKQIELLQQESTDKNTQIEDERNTAQKYLERSENLERDIRDLRRENERLQEDVNDLRRQLESSKDFRYQQQDDERQNQNKIMSKNRLLQEALDENKNLAENNVELEDQIQSMEKEMRDGRDEIEKTTDENLRLQNAIRETDIKLTELIRENQMQKDQIVELMDQVRSKTDADDAILSQVDQKVEEWKSILGAKDDKIAKQQDEMARMREQLVAANMDSEKTSVAMLTKALAERDEQIELLRAKVEEAAGSLEGNAALMEDYKNQMTKEAGGSKDKQQQRILTLQNTLKTHEEQVKDADTRAVEAEQDARAKDKELADALERMRQYEAGEYGLAEAVAEIKQLKSETGIRDRNIETLTKHINDNEEVINDLQDEVEDLRERLGLDPKEAIDLGEFRKKKGKRMEEDRALNRVLQKEIEQMEEERIQLKHQIRRYAQSMGAKAVAMGLTSDDMAEVDHLIENLKEKRRMTNTADQVKSEAEKDALKVKNLQLDREVEKQAGQADKLSVENIQLKARLDELEVENKHLEDGIRELRDAIQDPGDNHVLEVPVLDKLLAVMETRSLVGRVDNVLFLKARVDNLTGHNEELRKELKETRFEAMKSNMQLDKATSKMERMDEEIKTLREVGAGGFFQTMPLPEGMAVTSSDVIASLNEHLVQVLQELSLKEEMLGKMEESLETFRRKFAMTRHQQGLLYKEYLDMKKEWENEKEQLEGEMKRTVGLHEDDKVRIQEFDRLVDTLGQDEVEVRRRLADMTRKSTVLRVNEKALARRYSALQDVESHLRKQNGRLHNEITAMHTAVQERLGYLGRYKDMASFKIAALQKALEDSVPASELDAMNKKYTELTEKYRDILGKSNNLVAKSEQNTGYEVEVKRLNNESNILKQELMIEKEKLHTLEAAFDGLKKQGMVSSNTRLGDNDITSVSKKLTMLEMKELNERQRAEHASRMYDSQKHQLRQLEDRNFELEKKFSEITKLNLQMQKTERELRDELTNCVTKSISDADRKKISQLEESETTLKIENSRLKEISDVATMQVRSLEAQQQSRDKEVTSLRQQLVDFQAQSEEKTVIGKLHRHIVQLQVSEGMAVRKLEDSTKREKKLEAQLLRTEQKVDDKNQTIYHNRQESRNKSRHLKHTIQDLRTKYSGAVPLPEQEKFSEAMMRLQEEKHQIEEDLKKTNDERLKVEDNVAELQLKQKGMHELIATLQDGHGAQKVAEWHSKMEGLRLEELRRRREIERMKHQVKFQESLVKKHEAEVVMMEEEKVRQAKNFDERELEWEHREVELERIIAMLEGQQLEIAGAANQFEQAVGALPDTSWPVAKQLDHAVTTIKRNVKLIIDTKAQSEVTKVKIEKLEKELKEKDKNLLQRDKLITEMRLRLPATQERDDMILKATHAATGAAPEDDYEGKQAVRVAQTTVQSLQARLHQKEETVQKYQELLEATREDLRGMSRRHDEEMRLLQEKLHNKNDAAFNKFKQTVSDTINKPMSAGPTNEQLKRLNELEDIVADQDNSIAALREKLTNSRKETQSWKHKYEDGVRNHAGEKESILGEHQEALQELQEELKNARRELSDKEKETEILERDLEAQKDANTRAPTTTLKKLVERLRNDLSLKEKQHKALSKALMDLRAEMVVKAEEDVKAHAEQAATQQNVQKLVDKRTKEIQERLEDMENQNIRYKKDSRKMREAETSLHTEVDEMRHDLQKRDGQLRKAREDKGRLETEVEELEKKINRMSTMQKQRTAADGLQSEAEELRRKNRLLTEELSRTRHQAEKPYEQQGRDTSRDPAEQVAKWEESKKWQKMVDRLKIRLKDKEVEFEKLHKTHELAKHALERANKDKESLESKLRSATRQEGPIQKQMSSTLNALPPSGSALHITQELRKKNFELEEQVTDLKRRLLQGRDAVYEEVELRNKFLTQKLQEIETQMKMQSMRSSQEKSPIVGHDTYRQLAEKESNLQKQVIKLSEENLELRFEVEQAHKDIPRLKSRIGDLQKYVDVLKAEKEQIQLGNSARSLSSLSSTMSNVRRIGESGKSTRELEKTIALLKKVVERTQQENEALKRAPGVISNDHLRVVQNENQALKGQLEELRQKMGAQLSERYMSQQKGTAKMMSDYDKLRRDLLKEKDLNEKLRIQLNQEEVKVGQLQREKEGTDAELQMAASRTSEHPPHDTKSWVASANNKMYEEKIKTLAEENTKKTKLLGDLKMLLKESAQREQLLSRERDELVEQVEILKHCPPGLDSSDSGLKKEFQLQRLTVDRLEKEKDELQYELQVIRQRLQGSTHDLAPQLDDEVLVKLRNHDKLLSENVDLSTQLKSANLESDRLNEHVTKLKEELDNFGPDFFEEIEDLKYNYREAVQKNVQYEDQLAKLSRQFGVSVPGL